MTPHHGSRTRARIGATPIAAGTARATPADHAVGGIGWTPSWRWLPCRSLRSNDSGRFAKRVGARYSVTSCDLRVLMDQPTEVISSHDPRRRRQGNWHAGLKGRRLRQGAVRTVHVVMVDVLGQHRSQLPASHDRHPVQHLPPNRAHPPLRIGIRPRRRHSSPSRCHPSSVAGCTNRPCPTQRGSSRASPASTARSAQSNRGRATRRRSTATWWRSSRSSASLAAELRVSSASHPISLQNIRYISRGVIHRSSRPGDCPGELPAQHPRPTFWHPQDSPSLASHPPPGD
jgi:hypothetical protein